MNEIARAIRLNVNRGSQSPCFAAGACIDKGQCRCRAASACSAFASSLCRNLLIRRTDSHRARCARATRPANKACADTIVLIRHQRQKFFLQLF